MLQDASDAADALSKVKKTSMREKVIHKPRIAGAKPSSGSPRYKRGLVDFDGGRQLEAAKLKDPDIAAPSTVPDFVPVCRHQVSRRLTLQANLKGKTTEGSSALGHTLAYTPRSFAFLRDSAGARLPTGQQPLRLPRSIEAEVCTRNWRPS